MPAKLRRRTMLWWRCLQHYKGYNVGKVSKNLLFFGFIKQNNKENEKMIELNYPLNIQVELTEACNHKCSYCYNFWRPTNYNAKKMPIEKVNDLVGIIEKDIKPFHVTITGGEPLIAKDSVIHMIKNLREKRIFSNINTNLTLLNKECLEEIIEKSNTSQFGILTSLPHYSKETYNKITHADDLDDFYKNLSDITKDGRVPITVNMVVNKLNKDSVYEEGKFLHENYGIKNFSATPVLMPSYDIKGPSLELDKTEIVGVLETLLKLNEDFKMNVDSLETIPRCTMPEQIRYNDLDIFNRACSAGRSTVSISPEGEVRACSHVPFSNGNVFRDKFKDIWESLSPFRKNKYLPEECDDCLEFFSCYGGCRAYAYSEEKGLKQTDPRMTSKVTRIEYQNKVKNGVVIDQKADYYFNRNTIWREEKEGIYTLFNGNFKNVFFVNNSFLEFVNYLKDEGRIIPGKVETENYGAMENMLKILVHKKYLIKNDN
jgi:radical SAM protein with 4Fe4S-binding SPASM domain